MIDESGSVICEICHIAAQNTGGPRYDATQDCESRHGFDNLVLMCGPHHKVIDDDESTHTRDRLLEIKADHENGVEPIAAPEGVAEELLHKLELKVTAVAEGSSTSVAAVNSTVIVQTGISVSEARQIALDVYKANCLELRDVAAKVATQRATELTDAFLAKLSQEAPEAAKQMEDPDMQHAIYSAQVQAARTGDKPLADMLVDLLVERAKSPSRDLVQIVLTESIEVAGKLTAAHIDAMSLIFVLKYSKRPGIVDSEAMRLFFKGTLEPLLSSAAGSTATFQYLEYVGCGNNSLADVRLARHLGNTYPQCFVSEQPKQVILQWLRGNNEHFEILRRIGLLRVDDAADSVTILPIEKERVLAFIAENSIDISIDVVDSLYRQWAESAASSATVEKLRAIDPGLGVLEKWFRAAPSHFTLTSVGIALAISNLKRRGAGLYRLETWVN